MRSWGRVDDDGGGGGGDGDGGIDCVSSLSQEPCRINPVVLMVAW